MSKDDKDLTGIERKITGALDKLDAFSKRQRNKHRRKDEGGVRYATFNDRVFASVVDTILSFIILKPFIGIIAGLAPIQQQHAARYLMTGEPVTPEAFKQFMLAFDWNSWMLQNIYAFVIMGVFVIWMWNVSSSTPGKWLLKMRIVDDETFCKPSPSQSLKRYAGYMLSMIPFTLGFAWVMFDKKKRGWHDMVANTVVVKVDHWRFKDDGVTPHVRIADIKKDKS